MQSYQEVLYSLLEQRRSLQLRVTAVSIALARKRKTPAVRCVYPYGEASYA
ncbi:hypothetical protein [Nostoc sp. NMS4]|uniref:hypothetical protein n=1 Tax=Nostoc sp. NMS4 TaxID=2815390 RepID=UPI0025ECA4FD|nr:hypothetical protein [Nostoc sp. NMS4]MBN3926583.1 hypothetical protein [Nostoc sp. NMS4]